MMNPPTRTGASCVALLLLVALGAAACAPETEPPSAHVAVFEGYFGQGLSEAALAAELGVNRYRIRLSLSRIRRRMQRFLRAEGLA